MNHAISWFILIFLLIGFLLIGYAMITRNILPPQIENYRSGRKITEYTAFLDGDERRPIQKEAENFIQRNPNTLINAKILKVHTHMGDYGGAGPGFLGFLLEYSNDPKKEWMVLTLVTARWHCLLDGKWVAASALFYPLQKPLISTDRNIHFYDEFSPLITEGFIRSIKLTDNACEVTIQKNDQTHLLEILDSDPRLPKLPGYPRKVNGKLEYRPLKALKEGEKLGEFIISMEEDGKIYL